VDISHDFRRHLRGNALYRRALAAWTVRLSSGPEFKACHPCRRSQIRRLVRVQRRRQAQFRGRARARFERGHGHLPQLRSRWPLHLAAQDPAHQLLPVRLPVLRQPRHQQRAARALHSRRSGAPYAGFLSPQLHRGLVPVQRHHSQPRLHDGAGGGGGARAARRARLPRLHPPQDHSTPRPSCCSARAATRTGCRSTSNCRPN
jgi:hypothetical protein